MDVGLYVGQREDVSRALARAADTAGGELGVQQCAVDRLVAAVCAVDSTDSCGVGVWSRGVYCWAGRLHNQRALARRLRLGAHTPLEQLLRRGAEQFGSALGEYIDGPMAVAVVDRDARAIAWRRDTFGVVPSVYGAPTPDFAAVATCPELLVDRQGRRFRDVNRRALSRYLLGLSDGSSDDFMQGVRRLCPGESWVAAIGQELDVDVERPARLQWGDRAPLAPAEFVDSVRQVLQESIEDAFPDQSSYVISLSSGLDSAMLAAVAQRIRGKNDKPVQSASMVFPHFAGTDESAHIVALARDLRLQETLFVMEDTPPLDSVGRYRGRAGLGPVFHPGENHETEFYRRVGEHFEGASIWLGVGAEFLFDRAASQLQERLHWRFQRDHDLSDLVHGYRGLGLRRSLSHLVHTGARTAALHLLGTHELGMHEQGTLEQGTWPAWLLPLVAHRHKRRAPSGYWTQRTFALALDEAVAPSGWLDSWLWEMGRRCSWREQRASGQSLDYPYLNMRLWQLAQRAPLELCRRPMDFGRRSVMKALTLGWVPERTRGLPKHGLFDHFIVQSLFGGGRDLFSAFGGFGRLEECGLIDTTELHAVIDDVTQRVRSSAQPTSSHQIIDLWRIFSAEAWLAGQPGGENGCAKST